MSHISVNQTDLNAISESGFQLDSVVLSLPQPTQVFLVGGAVRDWLLKRPIHERDWVVQGCTPQHMLQAGFTAVGSDFPVFLHPLTHEEYALARTERKSGKGYKGFVFYADPEVTLEEDLKRRDFTFNAMAMAPNGALIDPYGGRADLMAGVFRHVSPAFAEDPLRVLRLARFLARYQGFTVHPDTLKFCQQLVDTEQLTELVPERVQAELNKGFGEPHPSAMIHFLSQIKAWGSLGSPNLGTSKVGILKMERLQVGSSNEMLHGADVFQGWDALDESWLLTLNRLNNRVWRWVFFLARAGLQSLADCVAHWRIPNDIADLSRVYLQTQHFLEMVDRLKCFKAQPFDLNIQPSFETQHMGFENAWDGLVDLEQHALSYFAAVDVYRKPARLQQALNILQALGACSVELNCIQQFTVAQLDGSFKAGLREALQGVSNLQAREQADAFRLMQIRQLFGRS